MKTYIVVLIAFGLTALVAFLLFRADQVDQCAALNHQQAIYVVNARVLAASGVDYPVADSKEQARYCFAHGWAVSAVRE